MSIERLMHPGQGFLMLPRTKDCGILRLATNSGPLIGQLSIDPKMEVSVRAQQLLYDHWHLSAFHCYLVSLEGRGIATFKAVYPMIELLYIIC